MYGRILVPIDGSETSSRGIDEAIRLARQLNSGVRLIHVIDPLALVSEAASSINAGQRIGAARVRGNDILTEGMSRLRAAGVEADSVIVEATEGPVGKYVVENARECQADLIVCGTHGRRGIRRVLMGSDAEYIVRHADVPVLLVRCPAGEPAQARGFSKSRILKAAM
jgi:nucleotide-binding universal stress UspA family protein